MSNSRKELTFDEIRVREKSLEEFDVYFKESMSIHRHVIIRTVYHGLVKYNCDKCDGQITFRVIPRVPTGSIEYSFVEMQSNMHRRCKRLDILL